MINIDGDQRQTASPSLRVHQQPGSHPELLARASEPDGCGASFIPPVGEKKNPQYTVNTASDCTSPQVFFPVDISRLIPANSSHNKMHSVLICSTLRRCCISLVVSFVKSFIFFFYLFFFSLVVPLYCDPFRRGAVAPLRTSLKRCSVFSRLFLSSPKS